MDKIENLLQQVSIIQKKYDEIAKITGENFNIFSVMNMERREVKTHSSFLGELLNPKGSHGLNDAFLKLFIKEVFGDTLVEFESVTANAITEEYIAQINEDKTNGGRVDIVIKDAKGNVILIENKIDAYEQNNQLIRYRNAYPQAKILFLTLTGKDSNTALTLELNQKDYTPISYEIHIVEWLEICLKEAVNYPMLREAIKQYIYLIKKLTNQTTNNKMSKEIISSILQNKPNFESAVEIFKIRDDLKPSMIAEIINKMEKRLKDEGFEIHSKINFNSNKTGELISFSNDLIKTNDLCIRLDFEESGYGKLIMGFYNKNDKILDEKLYVNYEKIFNEAFQKECYPSYFIYEKYLNWWFETLAKIYFNYEEFEKDFMEKINQHLDVLKIN